PVAPAPRILAPRAAARADRVRPAVLGDGLSARHVHAQHGAALPGARSALAARDPARVLLVRAGGLDGNVRRAGPAAVREGTPSSARSPRCLPRGAITKHRRGAGIRLARVPVAAPP